MRVCAHLRPPLDAHESLYTSTRPPPLTLETKRDKMGRGAGQGGRLFFGPPCIHLLNRIGETENVLRKRVLRGTYDGCFWLQPPLFVRPGGLLSVSLIFFTLSTPETTGLFQNKSNL